MINYDDMSIAVCDIETWAKGNRPNAERDELRYIGFRAHDKNGKVRHVIYHYSQRKEIQACLSYFSVIVGHNFKKRKWRMSKDNIREMGYDEIVLRKAGFDIPGVIVDTQEITEKRAKGFLYKDFGMAQMGLRYLSNHFKLESMKGDFDYRLLEKDKLTGKEKEDHDRYLIGDLDTTFHLFRLYFNLFSALRGYLLSKDVDNWNWIVIPLGTTAYKVVCKSAGLNEVYADDDVEEETYQGAYVRLPEQNYDTGSIYCLDFASLYPHCFMGGNLFSPVESTSDEKGWNGNHVIPSYFANNYDGVKGVYSRTMGKIEQVIQEFYNKRVLVKDKIKKENDKDVMDLLESESLILKLVMNTIYGISGSPKFLSTYNRTTARDCTAMGRRMIQHAMSVLETAGYKILYGDTDSAYILDPYHNRTRLEKCAKYIEDEQKASFNIDIPTHEFEIETAIKRMYFFVNHKEIVDKEIKTIYKKKCYIYITQEEKIKSKGLKIVKGDCSPIAKEIYDEHIAPTFLDDTYKPYTYDEIQDMVVSMAKIHPEWLQKRYRTNDPAGYKGNCIQKQISQAFGAGEHYLIPNNISGPGKDNRYDTLENLEKKLGTSWIDSVNIGKYIMDLQDFMIVEDRKLIEIKMKEKKKSLLPANIMNNMIDGVPDKESLTPLAKKDITLFLREFKVKEVEDYKAASSSGAIISKLYGAGTHKLIVITQDKKNSYISLSDLNKNGMDPLFVLSYNYYQNEQKRINKNKEK